MRTKSFREFGGKYSSKINSIQKHLVRNDRGAIQKQHKTKHDLAQHDRGAIRKTKTNWYEKMKSLVQDDRNAISITQKKYLFWSKVKQKSVQSQQKSTPNLGKTKKSDFE